MQGCLSRKVLDLLVPNDCYIHLLCKLHEIWSTDSQESHSNCCHEMSHFKAENAPNSILAGAPPQTPLGELTALPQTS